MKKLLLSILFASFVLAIPVNADTPSPPIPNPLPVTQSNPTLLNADVLIVNPSPIPVTGNFAITIPYSGPTASPAPAQAAYIGGVDGSGNLQGIKVNSSHAVTVDGSAVTQPVSGTFWQTTQPVSGTFFQSIQPVSQSGSWSNTCTQATGSNLHADIDNFPATQPISGSISVSNFPATQPISAASPIPVSGTFWQTTQPVSAASLPLPTGASTSALQTSGNTSLTSIATNTGNIPAQGQALSSASMPVVLPAAQITTLTPPTTVTVTQGTPGASPWPVSLSSVPLPTGGSTSALQTTGNSTLTTINTTLGSPFQAGGSIGNTSFAATQATAANLNATVVGPSGAALAKDSSLTTINTTLGTPFQAGGSIGNTAFTCNAGTNLNTSTLATSALQTTGNSTLTTINTTLGTPFQAGANIGNTSFGVSGTVTPLVYTNGSASNSAVIGSSSAITFSPPTHAVGFIIEAESGNTVNLRYACGTTATTSVGMLLEPGRDSGYVMSACTVTIIAVSSSAQSADIQWVLSQ